MSDERGIIYWNMEINPEEVYRRMECALCEREEAADRAFAESQRIFDIEVQGNGVRAGEIYMFASDVHIGIGKSRLAEICAEMETQVVETAVEQPKNKPHYRRIGRGNRY